LGLDNTPEHELADRDLWEGLRSPFLEALDHDQRLRIFDLNTRASRDLHRWAVRYPLIRRVRVWPISLSMAAVARFLSVAEVVSMARMCLWIFTIDDIFDEEIVPFPALRRRVERYKAILNGTRADRRRDQDTLVFALQEIVDDLHGYTLFAALQQPWIESVTLTLDAMMKEHEWRAYSRGGPGELKLPDYEEYLNCGLYSIGGPPFIWTALITIGDESTPKHLGYLRQMERPSSICLRLANDLQTYAKELAEDNINSVVLRQREAVHHGESPEQALAYARDAIHLDIQRELELCRRLQATPVTATGQPERLINDIARWASDFYSHYDYHTFATGTGRL
jgi:hypothetical protein